MFKYKTTPTTGPTVLKLNSLIFIHLKVRFFYK